MPDPLRVLLVEDSPDDAELIADRLRDESFVLDWHRVDQPDELEIALSGGEPWDIVLVDHSMPRLQPQMVMERLSDHGIDIPLIIVSGTISDEAAVEAMRGGAQDYVLKDNLSRLGAAVRRELTEAIVRRRRHEAEQRVRYLALYDDATGLPNRTHLVAEIADTIEAQPDAPFTLLVVAIERLDTLRTAFGVEYADLVFQEVVARMENASADQHE